MDNEIGELSFDELDQVSGGGGNRSPGPNIVRASDFIPGLAAVEDAVFMAASQTR